MISVSKYKAKGQSGVAIDGQVGMSEVGIFNKTMQPFIELLRSLVKNNHHSDHTQYI